MFNIGPGELIAIAVVALIVLGPQRLPDAMRQVGRAVGELRRISGGFQEELRRAMEEADIEGPVDATAHPAPRPIDVPSSELEAADEAPDQPAIGPGADDEDAGEDQGAAVPAEDGGAAALAGASTAETGAEPAPVNPDPPSATDQRSANGAEPSNDERAAS